MATYVKASTVNRSLVSSDVASKCATFCKKVEGQVSVAIAVFKESINQLRKLKEKYERHVSHDQA